MLKLWMILDAEDTFSDTDSTCDATEVNSLYVDFADTFDVCWNEDGIEVADAAYNYDDDDDDVEEVENISPSRGFTVYNVWWNNDDETAAECEESLTVKPCIAMEQLDSIMSTASSDGRHCDNVAVQCEAPNEATASVPAACEEKQKVEGHAFSPRTVLSGLVIENGAVKAGGSEEVCIIRTDSVCSDSGSATAVCLMNRDLSVRNDHVVVVPAGKWSSLKGTRKMAVYSDGGGNDDFFSASSISSSSAVCKTAACR